MNAAQIVMLHHVAAQAGKANMVGGGGTDPENNGKFVAVATFCLLAAAAVGTIALLNH